MVQPTAQTEVLNPYPIVGIQNFCLCSPSMFTALYVAKTAAQVLVLLAVVAESLHDHL